MNIIEERLAANLRFEIGSSSIIGTRKYQQDLGYYYTDSTDVVSVVCDGMGGMAGGERASKMAIDVFARDLRQAKPVQIPEFLQLTTERMDKAVISLKDGAGRALNAGTTCVAVYCRQNQMYWLSVGDSRIYLIRGNKIVPLNRDHNYHLMLKEQLKSGMITREFYEKEDKTIQAEALISYIGIGKKRIVDVTKEPTELRHGDMIVLCSDGIYKSLNDSQVQALVMDNDLDMNIAADRLTAMALRYGGRGQDNTTVILMKYQGN